MVCAKLIQFYCIIFFLLHQSADADQDGALDRFETKIVLSSDGRNMWLGPVLYTFSCKIDVNFFPFDEQVGVKNKDEDFIDKQFTRLAIAQF